MKRQSRPGTTFAEKLVKYTVRDSATGCLNWTASLSRGYGQHQSPDSTSKLAHISAWELANGPRPPGAVVRHLCHNPRCVESSHLAIGSQYDNIQDAVASDRIGHGIRHSQARLSEDDIRAIRADPRPMRLIADQYQIHYQTVYRIRKKLRWRRLD